jgi:hypothetical protein
MMGIVGSQWSMRDFAPMETIPTNQVEKLTALLAWEYKAVQ